MSMFKADTFAEVCMKFLNYSFAKSLCWSKSYMQVTVIYILYILHGQ